MRVKKAIINIVVGGVGTLFSGVLLFVSRIIFVQFLSDEYLGISSLLTNILSILSRFQSGTKRKSSPLCTSSNTSTF